MASYKYEVVGADGKPKTGTIEAVNMEVASAELKSGGNTIVSITYEGLPNDVQPGTRILIDDGLVAFEVEEIKNGTDIVCKARTECILPPG